MHVERSPPCPKGAFIVDNEVKVMYSGFVPNHDQARYKKFRRIILAYTRLCIAIQSTLGIITLKQPTRNNSDHDTNEHPQRPKRVASKRACKSVFGRQSPCALFVLALYNCRLTSNRGQSSAIRCQAARVPDTRLKHRKAATIVPGQRLLLIFHSSVPGVDSGAERLEGVREADRAEGEATRRVQSIVRG